MWNSIWNIQRSSKQENGGRKKIECQSNLDIGGNKGFITFFMFLIYSEGLQEAFKISLSGTDFCFC